MTKKKWYILTDGDNIYDFREMDNIDALQANNIMIESTDGGRYWKQVSQFKIEELIERSR